MFTLKKNSKVVLMLLSIILLIGTESKAWQYTVTNVNDAGAGSLRQCTIDALNNTAGTATGGVAGSPHTIIFNIGGAAPFVINQTGGNYNLYTADITIDATTQAGWAPANNPVVVVRGTGANESIALNGSRLTCKGLIFQNFQYGINVNSNVGGHIIQNCWFGLNAAGTATAGNTNTDYGIWLKNGCPNTLIGSTTVLNNTTRCVFSGNNKVGIFIDGAGGNSIVSNCFVGTDITGTVGLGNGTNEPQNHHGIDINNSSNTSVLNSVISFNVGAGIEVRGGANNCVFTNNKIGTDLTGNFPLGNKSTGMRVRNSNGHTIGGTTPALMNVISANGSSATPNGTGAPTQYDWYNMCGIYMEDVNNTNIMGNYIGTSVNGNTSTQSTANDLGNFYTGIKIVAWGSGSKNNTIGGATVNHRNVIGGNGHRGFAAGAAFPGHGIQFQTNLLGRNEDNYIYNNYIGIGANGVANIGNKQDGVSIFDRIRRIYIGGNGLGNVLSNNTFGVFIQNACTDNYILGNYIGTNATGNGAAGNIGGGVGIQWNSTANYVGRANAGEGNLISGNTGAAGVVLRSGGAPAGPANNNFVYNNIIGLQADGVTPMPVNATNTTGVYIQGGSSGNTIGGSAANQRNIIAGNQGNGVFLDNGVNNFVYGNNIGLDLNGAIKPNTINGVYLFNGSTGNAIGAINQRNFISGNTIDGVLIEGLTSIQNTVRSNYIGTNIAGTAAIANGGAGVRVLTVTAAAGTRNVIDANVISGNNNTGITLDAADFTLITGNIVGLNALGTAAIPNNIVGVFITNGSDNNTIGGSTVATRNIVSAHLSHGIHLTNSANNSILGNYIGLLSNGTATVASRNGGNGVSIQSSTGTAVGSALPGEGNVISNNGFTAVTASGVSFSGGSNNTSVINNIIGLEANGTTSAGNSDFGIWGFNNATGPTVINGNTTSANGFGTNNGSGIFLGDCPNSTVKGNTSGLTTAGVIAANRRHGLHLNGTTVAIVGGTIAADRNILSGNTEYGLVIETSIGNTVQGNSIGTDAAGTAQRGNSFGGINIITGGASNIIGGVAANQLNLIAYNTGNGINVNGAASINNSIHRNSIYCNSLRGIVLSNGGNNNYAKPVISASGTDLLATGPVGSFIEVFTLDGCNDCGADPNSDKLQGKTLVFSGASPFTFTPLAGTTYTATASVANATTAHNTSEFSTCYILCISAVAPTSVTAINPVCINAGGNITLTANGGSGNSLEWYTGSCGGTIIGTGNGLSISSPVVTTTYFVRWLSSCSNSACASTTVVVNNLPVDPTSASVDRNNFCTNDAGNIVLSATGGSGATLEWHTVNCAGSIIGSGNNLSIPSPSATTTYSVRWLSGNACPNSNCVDVLVSPIAAPTPSITGVVTSCANTSGLAFSTTDNSGLGNTYTWSSTGGVSISSATNTSAITSSINATAGSVTVTETAGACSTSVSQNISITAATSKAIAGNNRAVCVSNYSLNATTPLNGVGVWTVASGAGTFSPNANDPQATVSGLSNGVNEFVWTVTGTCGVDDDTVALTVGANGLNVNAFTTSDTACFGSPKDLKVLTSGTGSGNYTYQWTSSDNSFNLVTTTPNVTVNPVSVLTKYYLTIIDNKNVGCNSGDTVVVFALADQELVIPNLITPNGDQRNDFLEIKDQDDLQILPGASIEILNRWGDKVYDHSSYDNSWNAPNLSDGVYYYYLKSGCGSRVYKGWVQIIH